MSRMSLILFILLNSIIAHAQEIIPGLIPRFYSIEAATDLPLSPEEAHEQALAGLDLSNLEPDSETNIWKPNRSLIPNDHLIGVDEEVRYIKELPSRNGQLRFTIQTKDNRELIVMLSKKVHSFLLRKNILAKLGYATQPMSWAPRIKVSFEDTIDRDLFKEQMKDKLLAGSERWIKESNDLVLTLQDVLVLTPESDIYNLASGIMSMDIHQGRRLLRAPYIPLALVDTTESVNLMPWHAGRIVLNHVKLNHTQDLDTGYGTSWEDARWISKKLAKLRRADFEEIVGLAHYPPEVEKILVEKIVARRNDLMELLSLDEETTKLIFNPLVSYGSGLVNGEITKEFFDGYVSRFSYGDPESPFSASELSSFVLSRGQSQLIMTALSKLNSLLGTDDQELFASKIDEIVKKEGVFFPTQGVAIPTFHGGIILSRDIITGTYLGTNNKVQLVDNLGFNLDAGVFAAVAGMPIPLDLKAGGGLAFQRVFSHVKPVLSLKKSMKEPYKNMLVPMLLKDLGKKIDKLTAVGGQQDQVLIQSVVNDLKSTLAIGESFIITDSLVPRMNFEADFSISQWFAMDKRILRVYAQAQGERVKLTRFHLHRPNENTFQIYQDYGKNLKLMLTLKLRSYVPILGFNARWSDASVETHFYPISLKPQSVSVETLKALRQSIFSLNHDALQDVVTPHRVEHSIDGFANTWQLFMFKRNSVGNDQSMKLTHAVGASQKQIHRRYDAVTTGMDLEGYTTEAINSLVASLTKSDLALSQVQTLNPGFSLGGKAKNKIFISEFDGERLTTNYQRIINGFRVTPRKLRSYLDTLNAEAGRRIFDPLAVINTNSILLYQLSFTYILTQEGTEKLLAVSYKVLCDLIRKNMKRPLSESEVSGLAGYYMSEFKRIQEELRLKDPTSGLKRYHSRLKDLQDFISVTGLESIAGKDNLAYQGKIEGYRQGDENGDSPIFTHVYGELPLPLHATPTQQVMQNWGILEGELLANWMVERAI